MFHECKGKTRVLRLTLSLAVFFLLNNFARGAARDLLTGVWSETCPCSAPCPCWTEAHTKIKRCLSVPMSSSTPSLGKFCHSTTQMHWSPIFGFFRHRRTQDEKRNHDFGRFNVVP